MSTDTPFSPEALTAKYREERDKRLQLRPDGTAQYVDVSGIFADFARDPYVAPGYTRDPVVEEVDAVIVGAGFGGMMAAAELAKLGIRNIRIIDKAGDFGGTWYWNRYPGAACDVESYIYLPYLEETGYMPVEKYSKATEIFEHCQRIAQHFDLYPMALFQTEVSEMRWDEAGKRWTVTTSRGDRLTSRFAIVAGGVLHKPKLPGIPGLRTFEGHSFHTTRWDYDYTGGSPTTPMDKLAGKKVAIIGTGATAVQAVPKLAEAAEQLYVVQRTPAAVGVRGNMPTDPEWVKSLKPGWQAERMANFTQIMAGEPWDDDLIGDAWTEIYAGNRGGKQSREEEQADDFRMMEQLRARIEQVVNDNPTAEGLKPWYNRMCKRPCFHDEYLPSFNKPNVKLLDTGGKGVERLTENALVVDGTEYPVDCIIYASGFEMGSSYKSRLGFEIYGRNGQSLSDAWAEGPSTLHGIFASRFPNLLMISTSQGGFAINFVHMLAELAVHVSQVIKYCIDEGIETIEPTRESEDAWWNLILTHLPAWASQMAECTPSYMNGEGGRNPKPGAAKGAPFFGGPFEYVRLLREWRESRSFEGLTTTPLPLSA
jgi:cation diffusion facilitator CzcD-associated flavoprotein CzcO